MLMSAKFKLRAFVDEKAERKKFDKFWKALPRVNHLALEDHAFRTWLASAQLSVEQHIAEARALAEKDAEIASLRHDLALCKAAERIRGPN
jgi:hypothetical protein